MSIVEGNWHLKKEVSIITLVLLVTNILAVASFAVKLDTRVGNLEGQQATDARLTKIETLLRLESTQREALEIRNLRALDEIKGLLKELKEDIRRDQDRGTRP